MLEQLMKSPTMEYGLRAMQAASLRQDVISNNVANVNTPKFKRSDVIFEDLLARELYAEDDGKLKMVRTWDKHLPEPPQGKVEPVIQIDDTTTMRVDGNNVDIDREMAGLAKNQIYYNTVAKKVSIYAQGIKNILSSR